MSFIPRIKPRDQYLRDFFRQESEDPMANLLNEGDPYDPISPERIVEMREMASKERNRKEVPFWESFKHYSGIKGIGAIGDWLSTKPGFRPLAEDFPGAQRKAEEIADVIGGDVQGQAYEKPIVDPSLSQVPGLEVLSNIFGTATPSEAEAGIRGFGAGLVENPLKNLSAVDAAPFGRAAKFAAGAAKMTRAGKGLARGLEAASNLKGSEKGSLLIKSPEYVAKALQGSAEGLQGLERASGVGQGFQAAAQIPRGAEKIAEGNYAEGIPEFALGFSGAALGGRSGFENFLTPELVAKGEKGISDITSGRITPESLELVGLIGGAGAYGGMDVTAPGVGAGILSHGRYVRPDETEPVNPKLIERSELPFQESNRQFLENESMQDLFDFARRAMDVSKRNAESFVPEIGGELEGITFDRGVRGGNLGGDIRLNTELMARESPDFESYLPKLADVGTHELVHEKGKRPHGYAVVEDAARRVARSENPNEADIELGQTQMAMPESMENTETILEDIANSKTRPFEDPEGNYVPEPTEADFSFRTANEAAQNAARLPVEDLIQGYLKNPNDRATLEHAYLMQRGERPRGSSYRDYTDEAVGLSEVGPVESIEAQGPENEQRVFHGTPYNFVAEIDADHPYGKFNDDAIGNGEGSQAFGRGHYVAEDPQLARHYADNVARNNITTSSRAAFDVYKSHSSDIDSAISATTQYTNTLINELRNIYDIHGRGHSDEQTRKLSWEIEKQKEILDHLEKNTFSSESNLLSVEIPDEGYIELDKTLGEQSENIKHLFPRIDKARRYEDDLNKVVHDIEAAIPHLHDSNTNNLEKAINGFNEGQTRLIDDPNSYAPLTVISDELQAITRSYRERGNYSLADRIARLDYELRDISTRQPKLTDRPDIPTDSEVQQLKEAGIKGVKFKDRQSRYGGKENPTHNYVIFDPEDAKIVNKRSNLSKEELAELEKKYGRENLSKNVQSFFEGQPVEIIRRNGNRILIKLLDGTEQIVHPSKIKLGVEAKEAPKGQYEDITAELEALEKELGGEDVTSPKHITEQLSDLEQELTLDPKYVSIDESAIPEYATPTKPGRPGKQGPPKPPKELLEDVGDEGEGKKKPEDWLKTAAREVPKIERAQAGEIIRDQSFRDQIRLQDQLLKAQELEALKKGNAEEAQKIAMERKILRAQNAEEFSTYKRQTREQAQSEKEQFQLQEEISKEQVREQTQNEKNLSQQRQKAADRNLAEYIKKQKENSKLQEKIFKGQTKEDLELRKQKESFVGKGEDQGSPQGLGETLIDIWRVPAALKSSLDIPALSHSLTDTLIHPIEAAKNIKEAGKAALSPEHQEKILTEISQRKNFKNYEKAGIQFTKQGYDPNAQTFGSYTAEKIPGVKASERAQTVFLDKRRADLYDALTKDMGSFESDSYGHKKVAELVNAATGYGKLKSQTGEKIVTGLNQVMWSARLRLSRLNHLKLLGEAFVNPKMPASARKEIFKQASTTVGLGIGLLKLAEMAGAEVDLDPRSSKFARAMWKQEDGKVISWNPFAAYTPVVKLASQELTGTKITDKGEMDLTENKPFKSDRISILSDYGYSGLNPSAKAVFDALSSKTEMDVSPLLSEEMTDENPNLSKMLELVTPINVGNAKQLYDELGPVSALFAPLTTVGSNIDVYDPEKFKKQRERAARERGEEPKKKKGKRTGKVLSSY